MKLTAIVLALLLGFSASAQTSDCLLNNTNDEAGKLISTRTQEDIVINTAGRKWAYSMSNKAGQYALHLKYSQTDMIFAVPATSRLELTTADGATLTLPVKAGMEGEGRHTKGVKYWIVALEFPLNAVQMEQLQNNDFKTMKLDLSKGQATMAVPPKKTSVFRNQAKCISTP